MQVHPQAHSRSVTLSMLAATAVSLAIVLGAAADPAAGGYDATAWFAAFEAAYERGDTSAFGALLTDNYRFYSPDTSLLRRFPEGFTREDELVSHGRLFHGATARDGTLLPRALTVDVGLADLRVCPDPEFPGDPDHVFVHVGRASLAIRFADGSSMRDVAPHAFWLVRSAGGGGASGWTCRRWVERPAEELLADAGPLPAGPGPAVDGDDAAADPAWIPFPNPAGAGASVAYGYHVERAGSAVDIALFDVAGRRIAAIAQGPKEAGRHLARWDRQTIHGARAVSGVYFVRARVGAREERSRLVLVD